MSYFFLMCSEQDVAAAGDAKLTTSLWHSERHAQHGQMEMKVGEPSEGSILFSQVYQPVD